MTEKIILDKKIKLPETTLQSFSHFKNSKLNVFTVDDTNIKDSKIHDTEWKTLDIESKTHNSDNITNYDDECSIRYGKKTCLLIQLNDKSNIYQIRYMDKINCYQNSNNIDHVSKELFNELIPHLISYNYTVIVIENANNISEITAIHKPTGEFYSILNFY